jgi:APA family basic amino acid/polyamine antiporter
MTLLVLVADLSRVVAVSTFALLFYYTLANLSALRLRASERLYPRSVSVLGAASCLGLSIFIFFASRDAWLIGLAGLAAGAVLHVVKRKFG